MSMQHTKNLFQMNFEELERCHANMSNYSLIQASKNIRMLLLDSQPLVDILNRERQIPIVYRVCDNAKFTDEDISTSEFLWKQVPPLDFAPWVELKKDPFLKWHCVYMGGKAITLGEVIKFYAYVRGGVHLDNGKEFEELRIAFDLLTINKVPIIDQSMAGIVEVIYRTLAKHKEVLLA